MALKPNVGDEAERLADAVIMAWVGNRVSMRLQRDAIAQAIREATGPLLDACKFALLACQDNIAYANFKDEPVLLQAIDKLRPAIARAEGRA